MASKIDSRRVSVIAIMSATALGGNYALASIPNVEMSTLMFFVVAYLFGPVSGLSCMMVVSLIYGIFNPWGVFIPQIWLSQVVGWMFTVLIGSMLYGNRHNYRLTFILCGLLCTLLFDMLTNLGFAMIFGMPYINALIFGLPFMIVHVLSNMILFGLSVPVINRIEILNIQQT